MKKNTYWYKVDNAGKIFPAVSSEFRSSVFRLTFYLNEIIDPKLLSQAVNEILPRFEPFAVELKKGFFWYYLNRNHKPFIVKEEPAIMCKYVPWAQNNGYLLNVYYYKNKIVQVWALITRTKLVPSQLINDYYIIIYPVEGLCLFSIEGIY